MKKNASQMLNSFLSMQKDFQQDNGHSSGLDQRKSGTLLVNAVHKKNGQNCRANDVDIRRKQTPSLPIHEFIVQRSAQEQRL